MLPQIESVFSSQGNKYFVAVPTDGLPQSEETNKLWPKENSSLFSGNVEDFEKHQAVRMFAVTF